MTPPLVLPRTFYARPTLEVSRDLIGKVLVHEAAAGLTSGVIVEVEAYIGEADPACHAAPGPTARNAPLYGLPGFAYVYLNYGIHNLVNAVTEDEGSPAAVLIRVAGVPACRPAPVSADAPAARTVPAPRSIPRSSVGDPAISPGRWGSPFGTIAWTSRRARCGSRIAACRRARWCGAGASGSTSAPTWSGAARRGRARRCRDGAERGLQASAVGFSSVFGWGALLSPFELSAAIRRREPEAWSPKPGARSPEPEALFSAAVWCARSPASPPPARWPDDPGAGLRASRSCRWARRTGAG